VTRPSMMLRSAVRSSERYLLEETTFWLPGAG
jgi:hypothetical protein